MLLVPCPYCGPRPEVEFRYGGEAHRARPMHPEQLPDPAWAEYLFCRNNPKGLHAERWHHIHGCGCWFNAVRDTITDRFLTSYPMGQSRYPGPLE